MRGRSHGRTRSVMADAYTEERAEQLACIEAGLVEFAKQVDPKSLRAAVGQYTDAIDGDGGAGDDEKAYAKNKFHCSLVGDRVRGDLSLDPEAGEIVSAAVEAMAADLKVDGDTRRTSQKHADALIEICRRSLLLNHKHVSPSTRRRGQPHVSFIVDLQDLRGRSSGADRRHPRRGRTLRAALEDDAGAVDV